MTSELESLRLDNQRLRICMVGLISFARVPPRNAAGESHRDDVVTRAEAELDRQAAREMAAV